MSSRLVTILISILSILISIGIAYASITASPNPFSLSNTVITAGSGQVSIANSVISAGAGNYSGQWILIGSNEAYAQSANILLVPSGASEVAANPAGTYVYVKGTSYLNTINTTSGQIVNTITAGGGGVMTISPSAPFIYSPFPTSIEVIDTTTNSVIRTISLGGSSAYAVAFNPSGTLAYVAMDGTTGTVNVIDVATNTVVNTIAVGPSPQGIAFNPSGTLAYVAMGGTTGTVNVIDVATNTLVNTINVGSGPYGIVTNPSGTTAYVLESSSSSSVNVINLDTNTVTGSIPISTAGAALQEAINPSGTLLYVRGTGSIVVINTATDNIISSIINSALIGQYGFIIANNNELYGITYDGSYSSYILASAHLPGTSMQKLPLVAGPGGSMQLTISSASVNTLTLGFNGVDYTTSTGSNSVAGSWGVYGFASDGNGEYGSNTLLLSNTLVINPPINVSISSNPVLPYISAGSKVAFNSLASGGSGSYATYNFLIYNSITNAEVISYLTASNNFEYTIPQASAGNSIFANVIVTDTSGSTGTSRDSSTFTILPQNSLLVSMSSSPQLPASLDAGQGVIFNALVYGGTRAYTTYNFTIYNSVTGSALANLVAASNGLAYSIPSSMYGNTLYANVVVTDSAGDVGNSINSEVLTVPYPLSIAPSPFALSNTIIDVGQRTYATTSASNGIPPYYANLSWSSANVPGSYGTAVWQQVLPSNNLPTYNEYNTCVQYAGYAYCVGGNGEGPGTTPPLNVTYYAQLLGSAGTGPWQMSANSMPQAVDTNECVAYAGYVYCTSKTTSTYANVYYAQLLGSAGTGAWHVTANTIPYNINQDTNSCAVYGGYMYCVGGAYGSYYSANVIYAQLLGSGGTGPWQASANAIPVATSYAACDSFLGYIYCHGGLTSSATAYSANVYYAQLLGSAGTGPWQLTNESAYINGPTGDNTRGEGSGACVVYGIYMYCPGGTLSGGQEMANVTYSRLLAQGSQVTGLPASNSISAAIYAKNSTSIVISYGGNTSVANAGANTILGTWQFGTLVQDSPATSMVTYTNTIRIDSAPSVSLAMSQQSVVVGQSAVATISVSGGTGPFNVVLYNQPGGAQVGQTVYIPANGGSNTIDVAPSASGTLSLAAYVVDLGTTYNYLVISNTVSLTATAGSGSQACSGSTCATCACIPTTSAAPSTTVQPTTTIVQNYTGVPGQKLNITLTDGMQHTVYYKDLALHVSLAYGQPGEANVILQVYNYTAAVPGPPADYALMTAVNITVSNGNVTDNVTIGYPCSINSSLVTPFILLNGSWSAISKYMTNAAACSVSVSLPADPIVAIMKRTYAPPANSTSSLTTTATVPQPPASGSNAAWLAPAVIIILAIVSVAAYMFMRRRPTRQKVR